VTGQAGQVATPSSSAGASAGAPVVNLQAVGPRGGIVGVISKSAEKSFRSYNGKDAYNEWAFVQVTSNIPGQGGAPAQGGLGPGGRGVQPGGGMQPGGMGGPQGGRGQGGQAGRGGGGGRQGFGGGRGGPGTPDMN
jgi:single-strand DNA-binding protein